MKTNPQRSRNFRLMAAGALALSAILTSCNSNSGGPTEGESLRLTGRVVATSSAPVAGVVVALARNGARDTTDAEGRFELRGAAGHAASTGGDTVVYTKNGQFLARVSVMSWIDTLPDVQVVQRDISGLLVAGGATISRVEGVVTGDGIDSAAPVTADFYYNPLAGNYSGFIYFPPPSSVMNYQVLVKIYGPGDVLVGQSQTVPFTSSAGNVTVPAFQPGNARPIANAGLDTAVAPSTTIRLHGTATDSVGTISAWEWSIGGGSFVAVSSGDTTFTRSSQGAYPCILRVTDNDGNQALDTVTIAVLAQGVTWTARTSGSTGALSSAVWTGAQFVAVGSSGTVLTSPDGITWTTRLVVVGGDTVTTSFSSVAWNGTKLFVMGGSNGSSQNNVYTSTDGITWAASLLPQSLALSGLLLVSNADSTVLVAAQSNTSRNIARSEDNGATWITDTLSRNPSGILSAAWTFTRHSGLTVGVGGNGLAVSSLNGGPWVRHTDENSFPRPDGGIYDYTMTSVVSTGTYAVAVGYAGHVMRSADGITWLQPRIAGNIPNQVGASSTGDLQDVVWTGNGLVAVGNGYNLVSADQGVNWAQVQTGNGTLKSVAWNGTRLVAVGGSGVIVTSP